MADLVKMIQAGGQDSVEELRADSWPTRHWMLSIGKRSFKDNHRDKYRCSTLVIIVRAKSSELIQFMLMSEFEAEHHSRKDHAACWFRS